MRTQCNAASWGPALDRRGVRTGSTTFSRSWAWWGKLVMRRRWVTGAIGLAIVLGLAAPALSMNTGQPRANSLGGNGQPAQTLHSLERQGGVPSAVVFTIQVLTHGGPAAADRARAIAGATLAVYTVLAPATPSFCQGEDALLSVIPTAQNVDFNSAVYGNFPLRLTAIAIVTFLLLARTFRSVVLAAKAVLVNLVSLGVSCRWTTRCSSWRGLARVLRLPATNAAEDPAAA